MEGASCGTIVRKTHFPLLSTYQLGLCQGWSERLAIVRFRCPRVCSYNTRGRPLYGSWKVLLRNLLRTLFTVCTSTGILIINKFCRLLQLKSGIPLHQAVANVKQLTGLQHVRLAVGKGKTKDDTVSTIGLCAGSGGSVLKGVSADLYLTGNVNMY